MQSGITSSAMDSGQIDNSHECLRCHTSIIGMENYACHQMQCCEVVQNIDHFGNPYQQIEDITTTNSFFSSLELQSKFSLNGKIEEYSSRNLDNFDVGLESRCYSDEDDAMLAPPRSHTGGKWKPGTRPSFQSSYQRNQCQIPMVTRKSKRAVWKGLPEGCKKRPKQKIHAKLPEVCLPSQNHSSFNPPCPEITVSSSSNGGVLNIQMTENLNKCNESHCEIKDVSENFSSLQGGNNSDLKLIGRNSKNRNICVYCPDIEFRSKVQVLRHFKEYHKEALLKCELCYFTCINVEDLQRHCNVKHPSKSKSFLRNILRCDHCQYETSKRTELLLHLIIHQLPVSVKDDLTGKNAEKYKCPVCDKLLCISSLRQHIYKHTGDKHYECHICNRQFIQSGSLNLHVQTHSKQQISCDKCSYKTQSKASFKRHLLIHTDRPRPFICETCGSEHFDRNSLHRHRETHTKPEDKPLKCNEPGCEKTFISKADFAYHQRVHRNECPYSCDICDYKGKTSHQLKKHKRSHTGEKPFKCPHCSYATAYSTHLTRHLLIHSGDKPFTCPYCSFECNSIENIRKHILTTKKHAGKKVYPCRYCDQSFNQCSDFKDHLTSSHKAEVPNENFDVASVIAGLYKKVQVRKELKNPIPYKTKMKKDSQSNERDKNSSKRVKAVFRRTKETPQKILKSKPVKLKKTKKTNEMSVYKSLHKGNCDSEAAPLNVISFKANAPEIENNFLTTLACLPSDQLGISDCDKGKSNCSAVEMVTSIPILIGDENQQIPDSETINLIIESFDGENVSQIWNLQT